MPEFVILAHEAPLDGEFSLEDLPGAGRLDLLCRCVTASLLLSHDIRMDVRTHLVIQDELTIHFDGAELRNLRPDERSTAALIRGAIEQRDEAIGQMAAQASPGVSVSRKGTSDILDQVATDGRVVWLHEDGNPLTELPLQSEGSGSTDFTFVLSDHREFTPTEAEQLDAIANHRISVGPRAIHADQAIAVVHNYLDTDGYSRYTPD